MDGPHSDAPREALLEQRKCGLFSTPAPGTMAADGGPSAASPPATPPPSAAGCALALSLGLELAGSSTCASHVYPSPPSKLSWAAHLALLFDLDELVRAAQRPKGATFPEVSGPPSWREPVIRWSLLRIFHRLGFGPAGDRNEVRPVYCLSLPKGWVYNMLPGTFSQLTIFLCLQGANHG